jgi:DNA-binding NarL/FixJ family response regulator
VKVFIVEDSDAICERIVRIVNDVKDTRVVGTASKVAGALLGLQKYQPDVLILDIQLIDGNGLTVLQHMKKEQPNMKVIVLTNFNTDQYRDLAQRYGADAFLDKSNDFMQIPDLINGWNSAPGAPPNIAH